MKILYISHLSTNIAAGPNWSVPAGVEAQSKIDDVLWVNMTDVMMPHWGEVSAFHNVKEFGGNLDSLSVLPSSFNHPDVVVFESFYYYDDVKMAKMLRKEGIPYVIIPRGALTQQALHNHAWFKKWVAHKLFFDGYIKHAKAIQYLTKQEARDSIKKFHTPYFIIPNGYNLPNKVKDGFSTSGITASFIGRLDMYHKGIDLLLDAMTTIHKELFDACFCLTIYGPRRYDYYKIEKEIADRGISDIVAIHDEIGGQEKEDNLLNTDVFIMTSRFEGHPMGLIEALAYGIPCMVTPGTNMSDEIKISDAGWACEGNVDSIKETLLTVINQKQSVNAKSRNARELAANYDWDILAKQFHKKMSGLIK